MATHEYTFSGITNPSSTHKAWHTPDSIASPPSFGGGSEASTANYGQLTAAASPATPWVTTSDVYQMDHQYYRFVLDEAEGSVSQLVWDASAMQANTSPTIKLYVWNFDTSGWEEKDSQLGSDYTTLGTGAMTTNIANYIDENGYAYACIEATDSEEVAELRVDVVTLTVTYTDATFTPIVMWF